MNVMSKKQKAPIIEQPDNELTVLRLQRALAEEKIERLRLEFILTKAEHDKIMAAIAAKEIKT